MFLPMSCTSPLTVAIRILPRAGCDWTLPAGFFSSSMNGQQVGDGLFHHAGAFDDLRQEHLAGAEQVADDLHAVHQRAFDDLQAAVVLLPRFFDVLVDEVDDALDQRMGQPLFDGAAAPGQRRGLAAVPPAS